MANPKLSVELSAETSDFNKGMKDAVNTTVTSVNKIEASLKGVDRAILQATGELGFFKQKLKNATNPQDVAKFKAEIDSLTKKIADLGKQKTDISLAKPLQETANASTKATEALEKSIDVVNSVGDSSSSLSDTVGGLVGAFSGSAGLSAALAVAGAAYAIYLQYQKENESVTERNIRLTQEFNQELANGNAQAKTEISLLQSYVSVAKDVTVSKEGRLQAIKAINEIMPDHLGDIELDGIYSEETASKIDKYTKAVFLNAKVKAASSLIEKEYSKQFEAQAKYAEDNVSGTQKLLAGFGAFSVGLGEAVKNLGNLTTNFAAGSKIVEVYDGSINRIANNNLDKSISESNTAIEFFNNILNESNKELANMGLLFEDADKKASKLKSLSEILKELQSSLNVNQGKQDKNFYEKIVLDLEDYQRAIDSLIKNGFDKEGQEVDKLKQKYTDLFSVLYQREARLDRPSSQVLTGLAPKDIPVAKVDFSKAKTSIDEQLTEWKVKMADFNKSASNILSSGLSDAFSSLGQSIGDALASGGSFIENAGAALLGIIGNIATSLGKAAIGIGVGMLAIKAAFKNPLTAIAAGVSLVALGSFITNKVSKITSGENQQVQTSNFSPVKGFATGVNNFKGGLALVGEKGAELVNLPTGSSVVANDRTNRILSGNNRSQNVQIFGEVGFNMEQFVIRFRNAERQIERSGA